MSHGGQVYTYNKCFPTATAPYPGRQELQMPPGHDSLLKVVLKAQTKPDPSPLQILK